MASGGNWRFKSFLEAALPESEITPREMAHAWPDPGKKGDYRALSGVQEARTKEDKSRVIESEASMRLLGERGDEMYRQLKLADEVADKSQSKTLSVGDIEEADEGKVLSAQVDDVCRRVLFAAAPTEEVGTLFREFLDDVVRDGARARRVARDAANVMNLDRDRGDLPVGQDDMFAPPVARGGEIRDDRENYEPVEYDTEKHGTGARILEETIEQAEVDIIERQLQFLGGNVENAINREWLTTLVDDAFFDVDRATSSDSPNYKALNRAIGRVDLADFEVDSYVTHPGFRTALFEDEGIRFADRSGSDETVRERNFDPLLDLEHYGASGRTYDDGDDPHWPGGDGAWNYGDFYEGKEAAAGDTGAVVFNSEHSHVIMFREIETKDYEDPIRDIEGVNARAEFDSLFTQQRTACAVNWAE